MIRLKLKVKRSKYEEGFTLFELLTVMLLISTVGMMLVSIFVISLRSSSKAAALTAVRQNGNYAITQMGKYIRFAESLNEPDPCDGPTSTVQVTAADGVVTTFRFDADAKLLEQDGAPVIDTTEFIIPDGTFICTQQSPSDPPTITIRFTLARRNTGNAADKTASVNFETAVALRNWQR